MNFKNYFKPTVRRLLRDKLYLIVNILSLTAGLLCCLFIFKYVQHEWSYDQYHQGADQISRLELEVFVKDGSSSRYAYLGTGPVDWLHKIPGIEQETRFARFGWDMNVEVKGEQFTENGILAADSSFFELFSFRLLEGSHHSTLNDPSSLVISKSVAHKYFGRSDVTGESLRISYRDREALFTITGVVEDIPSNSHFSFDIVASADAFEKLNGIKLQNYPNTYGYIKVADNVSPKGIQSKLNQLYQQQLPEAASVSQFLLQPMTDIHLYSSDIGELTANSNALYPYLFTVIAIIVLGIAGANFTTLTISRSVDRAREMGVRKVLGAEKSSLLFVSLIEGILLSLGGLIFAYLLAWYLLPHFNQLAGKSFSFDELVAPFFIFGMIGLSLLTGLVAGLYPALTLSRNRASALMQQNVTGSYRGDLLWKTMVVTQFAVSIILISAAFLIQKQINFIHDKDLGFDKEQIVTFPNNFGDQRETFIDQLSRHPNITSTTVSSYIPGVSKTTGTSFVKTKGRTGSMMFEAIVVDHRFFETYDINLSTGRDFSDQLASDSIQAFVINQTAVDKLGWRDPLGKEMKAYGRDGYVIGVVEDFNLVSLHSRISPMVFLMYNRHHAWISAKIQSAEELPETLSYAKEIWQKILPNIPFAYNFVDDQFAAVYASEQKAQSLFFSFSVLAVIIAILGLFSFTAYSVQQRRCEIGIRKVLGATVYDILKLFYSGYVKLILIATLIALPAGYIWMKYWLQNFSYKTGIGIDTFAIPLVIALVILFGSVSYQTLKGALQNPAETIRSD